MLHEMPQVTVAAINGACAGAGLGWACGCDLRYAARSAKLNTAFLDVAVAGDMGLPWSLPRLVGAGVGPRAVAAAAQAVRRRGARPSASSTRRSTTTCSAPRSRPSSRALAAKPRRSPAAA